MVSRRKPNGETTIRFVQETASARGQTMIEFFGAAALAANGAGDAPLNEPENPSAFENRILKQVGDFQRFARVGLSQMPGYVVPDYVLEFAEEADSKTGRQPSRIEPPPHRPSPAMSAP